MQEQVNRWSDFLDSFLQQVADWAPKFIGALLILLIGYIIAKAIASLIRRALEGAKFDKHLHAGSGGNVIQRAFPKPSNLIASITFWIIFLGAISLGIGALGIPLLTDLIRGFYSYVPNIIAALLIFLIASAISAGIAGLVTNVMGNTPTGKVLAGAAPTLVMGLAIFMILNQLRIAPAIVTITYAALVGGAALGAALAFGLGGRDMAARILDSAYKKSQEQKGRVASDVRQGTTRAKNRAKNQARKLQQ
jgi:hypothetical protein